MRFQKYIKEAKDNYKTIIKDVETIGDLNRIIAILKKDCSKFLTEIKHSPSFMYRGTYRGGDFILDYRRDDRIPKDTPKDFHASIDYAFYDLFGWKARSEGVFTSSSKGTANSYGSSFYFFPKGIYRYVWSPKISDLYQTLKDDGYFQGGLFEPEDWEIQEMYADLYGKDSDGGSYTYKLGKRDRDGDIVRKSKKVFTDEELKKIATDFVNKFILKGNMFRYSSTEKQEMYQKQYKILKHMTYSRRWESDWEYEDFKQQYIEDWQNENPGDSEADDEEVYNFIEKNYQDHDIAIAINKHNEVMFDCESFYLLRADAHVVITPGEVFNLESFLKDNLYK
jgi:hypothetical protein